MNQSYIPKVAFLISGNGSNLQTFIDARGMHLIEAEYVCTISNNPDAPGLQKAVDANIPTEVVDHREFPSREAFDAKLASTLDKYKPDLIILAGFMRVLTPDIVNAYSGKMLNIHPSVLPNYPGLNTHQRAIDAGDSYGGATVHFVTPELDGGPPVVHVKVPIREGDDADKLAKRVFEQENLIYPLAVRWFLSGKLSMHNNRAWLFGRPLPPNGHPFKYIAID